MGTSDARFTIFARSDRRPRSDGTGCASARGDTHLSVAIITGSGGLIGSEAACHFGALGYDVVGIDNDMRRTFFGPEASTHWNRSRVESELGGAYIHHDLDIRARDSV